MKHGIKLKKLGRHTAHRMAMLRNLVAAVIEKERITTTFAKAKATQRLVDKVITWGKRESPRSQVKIRRFLYDFSDRHLKAKVMDELVPRFANRTGGYTRVLKLPRRQSDQAEMAVIELVDNSFTPLVNRKLPPVRVSVDSSLPPALSYPHPPNKTVPNPLGDFIPTTPVVVPEYTKVQTRLTSMLRQSFWDKKKLERSSFINTRIAELVSQAMGTPYSQLQAAAHLRKYNRGDPLPASLDILQTAVLPSSLARIKGSTLGEKLFKGNQDTVADLISASHRAKLLDFIPKVAKRTPQEAVINALNLVAMDVKKRLVYDREKDMIIGEGIARMERERWSKIEQKQRQKKPAQESRVARAVKSTGSAFLQRNKKLPDA